MKRERQEGGSASKVAAFFKRNIYFVLMIVCVLAIGAIITVAAVTGSEDDPIDTPTITVPGDDDDDKDEQDPPVVDDDTDEDGDGDDDKDDEDQKPAKTFTLDGILADYTIDIGFSDAELVFNPTQGHWATHQGVDLVAEAGTEVKCSFDGTVKSVTDDSFYGQGRGRRRDRNGVRRRARGDSPRRAPASRTEQGRSLGRSDRLYHDIGGQVNRKNRGVSSVRIRPDEYFSF